MSVGAARAHGAVTVLNATATGRGCALAVEGGVGASWEWTDGERLAWRAPGDSRLASAVHGVLRERHGAPPGATVSTQSDVPPARGLKTSSAAAAAMIRAGVRGLGGDIEGEPLATLAVVASIAAGVTLTGAYDDQVAVVLGGCHVTDNAAGRILASIPVKEYAVALWVPAKDLPKKHIVAVDTSPIRDEVEAAEAMLWRGDLPGAMTRNGDAFTRLYMSAGLPVKREPTTVALEAGALGAGLSGTGPAVAALFETRVDLPAVKGGDWRWTKTVKGPMEAA